MNNPTRNGKIARLPKAIRDELNQRLQDGATARSLVCWLNGLPAVKALVKDQFGGHRIREQNLSQWKNGGYRDWEQQQIALDLAERLSENARELAPKAERGPLSEVLGLWLGSRYVVATRAVAETPGEEGWGLLRQMCTDVVKLRRADLQAERLALERDRTVLRREQFEYEKACGQARQEQAEEQDNWDEWSDVERLLWAKREENQERICSWEETPEIERRCDRRRMGQEDEAADQADDEIVRAWLSRRRPGSERAWSDAEKLAWARLPENLDRIHAGGSTPEEQASRFRAILGIEEPEGDGDSQA